MTGDARLSGTSLRRWDANGFNEFSLGLLFCVTGGSLPLADWIMGRSFPVVVPVVMGASTLAIGFVIKKLRATLLYPRAGYVVFRRAISRRWIFIFILGYGALFTVADSLWRLTHFGRAWGPASGILFAALSRGAGSGAGCHDTFGWRDFPWRWAA